jgi:hypothetical protein
LKGQLAAQETKKRVLLPTSRFLQHTAVRPSADHAVQAEPASALTGSRFGQDFSQVAMHAAPDAARSEVASPCPVTPTRCPFGGACHTCPVHVQTKLAINQPGDEYEEEADWVADQTMRAPGAQLQRHTTSQPEPTRVPPIVHEVLRSPGQPLDTATRAFMEPRFGRDFSDVRMHNDATAAESARAVNALAYTVGRDVVFGSGQYAPGTAAGERLLAHELTHVVQQMAASHSVPGRLNIGPVHDRFEQQADRLAEDVAATPRAPEGAGQVDGLRVQRQMGGVKEAEARAEEESSEFRLPPVSLTVPPRRQPSLFPPGKEPHLKFDLERFCTHRILAEGTCKDLALGSKYICCDPTAGYKRPGRKTSIAEPGKTCESEKWTPIFTCDNNCKTALSKGCDDDDHWMALPPKEFSRAKCNAQYTICANGRLTWGYVRDRSSSKKSYEVSPGIQKDLGVKVGDTFRGAIYPPGTDNGLIQVNPCCNWPPTVLPGQLELQLGEPGLQRAPLGPDQDDGTASSAPGTQPVSSQSTHSGPGNDVRQLWLAMGKQPGYGILPKNKRTPMTSGKGHQRDDEKQWIATARAKADQMRDSLKTFLGPDKDLRVTSIVKSGEHTRYRKMDVARAGTTTWEELAAAAVHAGFWVHAEGVKLGGKNWPLSPKATGPHLDLYQIRTVLGDFPTRGETAPEGGMGATGGETADT